MQLKKYGDLIMKKAAIGILIIGNLPFFTFF